MICSGLTNLNFDIAENVISTKTLMFDDFVVFRYSGSKVRFQTVCVSSGAASWETLGKLVAMIVIIRITLAQLRSLMFV